MKKLLLIAAASAALSTSAMAAEGDFYGRGDVALQQFTKFTDKDTGLKLKSKWSTGLELGAGYNVMDNVRGELVWVHAFNPELKKTGEPADGTTLEGADSLSVKHKATIDALLVKAYVDVADLGMAKLFVGGGLGLSMIKEKGTIGAYSVSTKKKNTLAWTLGVGAGFEVADGVMIDLQYAYTDFGKTKSKDWTNADPELAGKNGGDRYRSNAIKLGVRISI